MFPVSFLISFTRLYLLFSWRCKAFGNFAAHGNGKKSIGSIRIQGKKGRPQVQCNVATEINTAEQVCYSPPGI